MKTLMLMLVCCISISAQVCPYPAVTVGTAQSTVNEPNCQNFPFANSYAAGRNDVVHWPGVYPQPGLNENVTVFFGDIPCSSSAFFMASSGDGWTTRSQQTGPYSWLYYSRYKMTLRVGSTQGSSTLVSQDYVDGCFRSNPSPILIALSPGADVALTSAVEGVDFDLESSGRKLRLAWTSPGTTDVAWLVRGGTVLNGSSLFGNLNPQAPALSPGEEANGYRALRLDDQNGDGRITASDSIFSELGLWFDLNHNGESEAGEIIPLSALVSGISLDYKAVGKKDEHGSLLRFRAEVTLANGEKRFSYDVYPALHQD